MIRVSTPDFFARGLQGMQRITQQVGQVQDQLSSGMRLQNPVDDPAGAASVSRFSAALAAGSSFEQSVQRANTALSAEEGALANVGDLLQRVRELALAGQSAAQSSQSRAGLATEVEALRGQLMSLANGRGADGEHLFGGFSVDTPPFQETAGVVSYVGDGGQRRLDIGTDNSIAIADTGVAVFSGARAGNGTFLAKAATGNLGTLQVGGTAVVGSFVPDNYTVSFAVGAGGITTYTISGVTTGPVATGTYQDGDTLNFNGVSITLSGQPASGDSVQVTPAGRQDAFAALAELASALRQSDAKPQDRAEQANRLNRAVEGLDQQLLHVSSIRADVGSRMKAAEVAADAQAGAKLHIQQALSEVQDLDYAEASTRLSKNLTALQAVQATFSKVSSLSLFNYLR